jgi:hypothetical protein
LPLGKRGLNPKFVAAEEIGDLADFESFVAAGDLNVEGGAVEVEVSAAIGPGQEWDEKQREHGDDRTVCGTNGHSLYCRHGWGQRKRRFDEVFRTATSEN